jgi:hypothetical protein
MTDSGLREVLGILGPDDSQITDPDERTRVIRAVKAGNAIRESTTGTSTARVVEYRDPNTGTTRYAAWYRQHDNLTEILDSADLPPVEASYEQQVWGLAEDCGFEFLASDVPGAQAREEQDDPDELEDGDEDYPC